MTTNTHRTAGTPGGRRTPGTSGAHTRNFVGQCPDLPVYLYSDPNQADAFKTVTEAIGFYCGRTMKFGNDIKVSLENSAAIAIPYPNDPAANASRTAIKIWEGKCQLVVKREALLAENLMTACTIVYGQCPDVITSRLTALVGFEDIRMSGDVLGLLKALKKIVLGSDGDEYPPMAILTILRKFLTVRQNKFTLPEYLDHFNTRLDAVVQSHGTIAMPGVIELVATSEGTTISACDPDELSAITKKAEQRFAAMIFLQGANKLKNGDVASALHNTYLQGGESYPTDVAGAYNLLCRWRKADATNANTSEIVASTNFLQSHVERIVEEVNNLDYDGIF